MNRRRLLKGVGGVSVLGIGGYVALTCGGNVDTIDSDQQGQRVTVNGKVKMKRSDGASFTLIDGGHWATVYVREPYRSTVRDMSIGSCASATGIVDDVRDGDVTIVDAEV